VPKESATKVKLRSFFDRNPKPLAVATINGHFRDVKEVTLNYNLQGLVKEGYILRRKRGIYQRNAAYLSPEDKRKTVAHHIATNGSRIQTGAPWTPGAEPLKESIDPVLHAYLAMTFGESVVERMKNSGFTAADVRFVESLLSRVYGLSAAQRTQAERSWEPEDSAVV
jgi:hypothetical protein